MKEAPGVGWGGLDTFSATMKLMQVFVPVASALPFFKIPRRSVQLGMLIVAQLVRKVLLLLGTPRFIPVIIKRPPLLHTVS
jgi:hypothetical protein